MVDEFCAEINTGDQKLKMAAKCSRWRLKIQDGGCLKKFKALKPCNMAIFGMGKMSGVKKWRPECTRWRSKIHARAESLYNKDKSINLKSKMAASVSRWWLFDGDLGSNGYLMKFYAPKSCNIGIFGMGKTCRVQNGNQDIHDGDLKFEMAAPNSILRLFHGVLGPEKTQGTKLANKQFLKLKFA